MLKKIPPLFLDYLQIRRQPDLEGPGLTRRSLLLGLGLVLAISLGAPYSVWIVGSSEITWSFFPIGVGAPFVLLVFVNALVKRFRPERALRPAELITILVMGLVVSGMPIFMVGIILAIISKPYYGATPENEWALYIQPYLPEWAVPTDHDAMKYFYEGLPVGVEDIPFGPWIGPLLWWLSLVLAVYFVCFCLVVILRQYWTVHERLAFPLAEVPLLLVEERSGSALPPVFRARPFWIGAALPLGIILFNMINYFHPAGPTIPVHQFGNNVTLVDGVSPLTLMVYFPVVGFVYLVNTSISFSVWFFYLLISVQTGLINWSGYTLARPDAYAWGWKSGLAWQAYGAFVAMVLWSLWMGRHHLRAVGHKVFTGQGELDDADEMISYRVALYGLVIGALFVLVWLCRSGMDVHVAVLYLLAALIIFLGITRLVIQTGLHYLTTPMSGQGLVLALTGTAIAPHNLVGLALSYGWCGDVQSIFMTSAAHAAKLNERYRHRRRLGLAMLLAVLVSFVATVYFMLDQCYFYGAGNFKSWFFAFSKGAGGMAFDPVVQQLRNPWPVDWGKLGFFGFGALLYSLLYLFHCRLYWWPLHPVGMTIATLWMVRHIVFSVFIAWALKRLILRFGGAALYQRLLPFFIGLPVGFFLGVGISYLVDVIWFPGSGHPVLHG